MARAITSTSIISLLTFVYAASSVQDIIKRDVASWKNPRYPSLSPIILSVLTILLSSSSLSVMYQLTDSLDNRLWLLTITIAKSNCSTIGFNIIVTSSITLIFWHSAMYPLNVYVWRELFPRLWWVLLPTNVVGECDRVQSRWPLDDILLQT